MAKFPPYIFGLHDAGGEGLMASAGKPGWVTVSARVSDGGGDFTALESAGLGVIVRLNHGYSPDGTLPPSSDYDAFAQQCAAYVSGSHGANIWIIGNETNLAGERPGGDGGQVITPDLYAQCFAKCRAAILKVPGHAADFIAPAPPGPWNPQTTYPGNPNGDWIKYYADILNLLVQMGAPPGALALHAYTHGSDPALLSGEDKMGPPFPTYHSQFRTYRDFLGAVPAPLRVLPVFITEAQPADPTWWQNRNTGWVQAAYAEINAWNAVPGNQPIQALCLFRWEQGNGQWSISDKPAVQDDFRAALMNNYAVRMPKVGAPQPQPQPQPQPKPQPAPQGSATGWCPFAVKRPIPGNFDVGRSGRKPKAVVLHIAAGPMSAVFPTFANPAGAASAHFCVGKDGSIEQYVSIDDTAYGNGLRFSNGQWFNARGVLVKPTWQDLTPPDNPNLYTISIEHDGVPEDQWTPQMYEANTRLLKWIAAQCNLTYVPHRTLVGHYEINSVDRPNCPGPNVDYERICADANAPEESPEQLQAIEAAASHAHQMPINSTSALFKYAQANGLGCPQTDETDLEVAGVGYSTQVFGGGILYVKKGDWDNVQSLTKPQDGSGPVDPVPAAAVTALKQITWMPINVDSALYKYAQAKQLGCPQSDEFEFVAAGDSYIGQVFVGGFVYVKKGDWDNIRCTDKPIPSPEVLPAAPVAPVAPDQPTVPTAPPPAAPSEPVTNADAGAPPSGLAGILKKLFGG